MMCRFGFRNFAVALIALFAPVSVHAHDPQYPAKADPGYGAVFFGLSIESTSLLSTLALENYAIPADVRSEVKDMQKPGIPVPSSAAERAQAVARFQTALNRLVSYDETTVLRFAYDGKSDSPKLVVEHRPTKIHLLADSRRLVPVIATNASSETVTLAWETTEKGSVTLFPGGVSRFFVPVIATLDQERATIVFHDGHNPLRVSAPVDVRPSGRLQVSIRDDKGERSAARVYVKGPDGNSYFPEDATKRLTDMGEPYSYIPSSATLVLPAGESQLEFVRGFEYRATTVRVTTLPGRQTSCTVSLERWIDMPTQNWYSGDGHIHMSLGGTIKMTPEATMLILEAEDVHLGNMVVSNCWADDVFDREHFEGRNSSLSAPRHIMRWGEEYRNDHIGHLILYNLKKLTDPVYAGFANTPWPDDVPLNADIADQVLAQGGFVTGAHPMPNGNEHAIDIALGKMGGLEIAGYGAFSPGGIQLLHSLWDCGFRTVATAGTDSFLNVVQRDPLGGARCYARVEGPFTNESWMSALAAGRTFVSNAPMLFFDVDSREPGAEIKRAKRESTTFTLTARAVSPWPLDELTVVYNGRKIATAKPEDETKNEIVLRADRNLPQSGWIAAMCSGPHNRHIMGGSIFKGQTQLAHTSPVWIRVEDRPQPPSESAKILLKATDTFLSTRETSGTYANDDQRRHMREVYGKARTRFADLARQYDEYTARREGEAR